MGELVKTGIGAVLGMTLAYHALALVVRLDLPEVDRFRVLEQGRPPFDVVMIGSSFVEKHFIPSVFDAEMRKRGFAVRSLNLGIEGMAPYEQDIVLDALLELDLPDLRWVLIDISMSDSPIIRLHDTLSDRTIRWHDLRQAAELYDYYRTKRVRDWRGFEDVLTHLRYLGLHYGRVGQGLGAIRRVSSAPAREAQIVEAGYKRTPTGFGKGMVKPRGGNRPGWKKRLAEAKKRLKEERIEPIPMPRVDEWEERVRARGKEAIFVRSPLMSIRGSPLMGGPEAAPAPFFDFANPELYPELYWVDSRFDSQHLSHLGATRLTRRLAHAFAARLSGEPH